MPHHAGGLRRDGGGRRDREPRTLTAPARVPVGTRRPPEGDPLDPLPRGRTPGPKPGNAPRGEPPALPRRRGVTLVELVLVILLIGILSVFVLPRLFDLSAFSARGTFESLESALRYARKEAYATGCPVTVTPTAGAIALTQETACTGKNGGTIPVLSPAGTGPYTLRVPSGVAVTFQPAGAFTFDALGGTPARVTASVNGGGFTGTVTVHAPSGFVSGAP